MNNTTQWVARWSCSIAVVLVLATTSCTADSIDTDSDFPADSDTDLSCDAGERGGFVATQKARMCAYWESCPGDELPFDDRIDCENYLQTFWTQFSWDECEAARCFDWLVTEPECDDPRGAVHPSCDAMIQSED